MSLKWFAIGLGIGAGVAILSTPKTGAEMRDMLKDIPNKARRYAAGKIEEEHYTITDVINEINESKKVVTNAAADSLSEAS
jgi:gas vesicle protein